MSQSVSNVSTSPPSLCYLVSSFALQGFEYVSPTPLVYVCVSVGVSPVHYCSGLADVVTAAPTVGNFLQAPDFLGVVSQVLKGCKSM